MFISDTSINSKSNMKLKSNAGYAKCILMMNLMYNICFFLFEHRYLLVRFIRYFWSCLSLHKTDYASSVVPNRLLLFQCVFPFTHPSSLNLKISLVTTKIYSRCSVGTFCVLSCLHDEIDYKLILLNLFFMGIH